MSKRFEKVLVKGDPEEQSDLMKELTVWNKTLKNERKRLIGAKNFEFDSETGALKLIEQDKLPHLSTRVHTKVKALHQELVDAKKRFNHLLENSYILEQVC